MGLNSLGNSSGFGWLTTAAIFGVVLLTLFILSKNFRQFICGSVVTGVLLINFKFSRWVGVSTIEDNFRPIKWTAYVIGFVMLSIIIGRILAKFKWFKNLEESFKEEDKGGKNNGLFWRG